MILDIRYNRLIFSYKWWDGWPPHSRFKRLFMRRKYFLIPFEGQNRARKDMGFSEHLWTHPDRRLGIIEG
jgi:hypothetical protein